MNHTQTKPERGVYTLEQLVPQPTWDPDYTHIARGRIPGPSYCGVHLTRSMGPIDEVKPGERICPECQAQRYVERDRG